MIKTVLIDDEIDSIRVLRRLLETYCPEIGIAGTADGVEAGLRLIQLTKPDLIFLDIEMAHGNAFDLLNQLKDIELQVIFVTAFDSYAIKAFRYGVSDYLVKPVNIDILVEAVEKVKGRIGSKDLAGQIRELRASMETVHLAEQKMAVPTITGLIFVTVKDILRFEARGSYTAIHLANRKEVLTTRNIKEYEDLLPEAIFCRVHRSYIVNIHRVKEYQKGKGGYIIMEDGTSIEVATRRREDFLKRLLK
jgi:two-component system, LytTR family, response regulator